jgi:prepilin-type N-terminal cleavage/methylation domain-containing protein
MQKQRGFTVIELLIVLVLIGTGAYVFFSQRATLDALQRDETRKTAVNAMYYSLEEVYYEKNGYYPETIDSKTLRSVDPALFADPRGVKLGEQSSNYRYEPTGCTDSKCTGYTLSSTMEKEDTYKKTSRTNG